MFTATGVCMVCVDGVWYAQWEKIVSVGSLVGLGALYWSRCAQWVYAVQGVYCVYGVCIVCIGMFSVFTEVLSLNIV